MKNMWFVNVVVAVAILGLSLAAGCATTGDGLYGSRWRGEGDWKVPPDPDCGIPGVGAGTLMISRAVPEIMPAGVGIVLDGGMFTGHGPLGKDAWFLDTGSGELRLVGPGCGLPMTVSGDDILLTCDHQVSRLDVKTGAISLVSTARPLIMTADADHVAWVAPYQVRQFRECTSAGRHEFALVMCDRAGGNCRTMAALPEQPNSMIFGENEIVMAFGGSIGGLWVVGLDAPADGAGLPGIGIHRDWAAKPTHVIRAGGDYIWYDSATGRIIRQNRQFRGNAYVIDEPRCTGEARKRGFCGVVGLAATDTNVIYLTPGGDLVRVDADGRNAVTIWSGGLCDKGCSRPLIMGKTIAFIHNWQMVMMFDDGSMVTSTDIADLSRGQ